MVSFFFIKEGLMSYMLVFWSYNYKYKVLILGVCVFGKDKFRGLGYRVIRCNKGSIRFIGV